MNSIITPIRHGLIMAVTALILGALWAGYMATHHEQLHGDFETAVESQMKPEQAEHSHGTASPPAHEHGHDTVADRTGEQHSHSGNLAQDAMQRLLRGHIHFMGIGVLSAVLLLITAFTSLKACWKKVLGFTFGLGALAYPPAWILMGFRTVELGPQAAEASVMWLFGPAVALLLASMFGVLTTLLVEFFCLQKTPFIRQFFHSETGASS
ncbi:MAG: hypothetical protein ABUK11_01865 [Mariprofundaceae bacterium]